MNSQDDQKYQVLVFIPTHACACSFAKYMDDVFKIFVQYKHSLRMDTKDSEGPLAKEYDIHQKSIVFVNPPENSEPKTFTRTSKFKTYLEELFRAGLIQKNPV